MDIKVGDYVRTKSGEIGIFVEYRDDKFFCKIKIKNTYYTPPISTITKHSKNIIDLIEVGDIVNKSEVYEIGQSEDGQKWVHIYTGALYYEEELEKATILTHEQYNQNCFKVKGE